MTNWITTKNFISVSLFITLMGNTMVIGAINRLSNNSTQIGGGKCRHLVRLQWTTYSVDSCCVGYNIVLGGLQGGFTCSAICRPPCIHGVCTAPGECTCEPGYKKGNSANMCEPDCTPGCINSTCIRANECICFPGFSKSEVAHACEPHCTYKCVHGSCSAPETCSCDVGYELSATNKSHCEPICSLECENGYCSAPEQCTCYEGFTEYDWNLCAPYCSSPCINGQCTAPEKCTCLPGYLLNVSICEAQCSKECVNGECIAPDVCSCNEGFEKDEETSSCVPVCSEGCENGICTAPDTCLCHKGFQNNNGTCVPSCDTNCINGNCTSPNECSCNEGTLKSSWFHCIPTCDNPQHGCSSYSTSSLSLSEFAFDSQDSYINFAYSPSMQRIKVPCNVGRPFQYKYQAQNYDCFTEMNFQEASVLAVCTLEDNYSEFNATEMRFQEALNLTAVNIEFLNVTIVHEEQAILCSGYICPDSNRTLVLNEISRLRICLHHQRNFNEDENSNVTLILGAISMIVVGGLVAIVLIRQRQLCMWTAYNVNEATRDDRNNQSLCNLEDSESEIVDEYL